MKRTKIILYFQRIKINFAEILYYFVNVMSTGLVDREQLL